MDRNEKDLLVFIMRGQPLTRAHIENIRQARNLANKVLVLIGSSGEPRTLKNPFSFEERKNMVQMHFKDVLIEPIFDYPYNDTKWLSGVQSTILKVSKELFGENAHSKKIGLIGHKKDNSSYYLNMFPGMRKNSVDVESQGAINATDVRNAFYQDVNSYNMNGDGMVDLINHVSEDVYVFVNNFFKSDEGKDMIASYNDNVAYVKSWANSPYPPTFVTVDNVVIQSGHVLMVKRKFNPGKGLWALPGGFVESDKTIKQCLIKELREETGLKVVDKVLLGNIINTHVFDKPDRSIRGRTITHAFHIDLGYYPDFPAVKGGDDAAIAAWVPLGAVERSKCFEDHYHIISHFTGI